ncbi:S1 domain-containing protein [Dethiosulfovibrio salsuginis]|uniref:Uncharacterized protein n=1 Tax=Dethiosulfovibrio salsuginis TaxID=561720 RepID=A0A1X7K7Q4_9BACT|nr:hypothetical protein [Dethiosulfovibrio salsuginis]SMG36942.1 hypothetical protein SAMN06275492_12237 [Dethiosulfovibrio salsuginis]
MAFNDFMNSFRRKDPSPRSTGEGVYEVINSEGEIYVVDTNDKGCKFRGPAWKNVLSSAADESLYIPAEAFYRKRSQGGDFAGYEVHFGQDVKGFMPRSRSGYYYDENRDATGKRLSVRVLQFYPQGPKAGNVVVEMAQLHGKNGVKVEKINRGSSLWGLAVDYREEGYLILELPNRHFGLANISEALWITRRSAKEALTGRFYHVTLGQPISNNPLPGPTYQVNITNVQEDRL